MKNDAYTYYIFLPRLWIIPSNNKPWKGNLRIALLWGRLVISVYKYCVGFDKLTAVPKPRRYKGLLTATTVIFVGKIDSYMSTRNSVWGRWSDLSPSECVKTWVSFIFSQLYSVNWNRSPVESCGKFVYFVVRRLDSRSRLKFGIDRILVLVGSSIRTCKLDCTLVNRERRISALVAEEVGNEIKSINQ